MDLYQGGHLQWSKTHGNLEKEQNALDYGSDQLGVCTFSRQPFPSAMHENRIPQALTYDVDVPCVVQRRMLSYCAPTSLHNDWLNDGVTLEKYSDNDQFSRRRIVHLSGEGTRQEIVS